MGSGNAFLYGPDHLVAAGVVLVTLNYRLGALGFLSLENDEVPGNMGLKVRLAFRITLMLDLGPAPNISPVDGVG